MFFVCLRGYWQWGLGDGSKITWGSWGGGGEWYNQLYTIWEPHNFSTISTKILMAKMFGWLFLSNKVSRHCMRFIANSGRKDVCGRNSATACSSNKQQMLLASQNPHQADAPNCIPVCFVSVPSAVFEINLIHQILATRMGSKS